MSETNFAVLLEQRDRVTAVLKDQIHQWIDSEAETREIQEIAEFLLKEGWIRG